MYFFLLMVVFVGHNPIIISLWYDSRVILMKQYVWQVTVKMSFSNEIEVRFCTGYHL